MFDLNSVSVEFIVLALHKIIFIIILSYIWIHTHFTSPNTVRTMIGFQYGWRCLAIHYSGILSKSFLCNQFVPIIVPSTLGFCLQNSFADQNILLVLVTIRFSPLGSYFTYEYSSLSIAGLTSVSAVSEHQQRLLVTDWLASPGLMFTCMMLALSEEQQMTTGFRVSTHQEENHCWENGG